MYQLVDKKGRSLPCRLVCNPKATKPDYLPGENYILLNSNVTLYAVWYESLTLAPALEHLNGYYMVVDAKRQHAQNANTR